MIALYSRVSTQEQARDGYSIGEQIERLNAFCTAKNWRGIKEYTDAGFSGGNINRPALQELIMDVQLGQIERVVVFKLDRLSRSQKDTLELIEDVFLANGCDFVSMSENFDTSSPFGKAMIGILAVFAQLEREQIRERMTIGKEARAKDGKWHGSTPPIGYEYKNGQLVINDFESLQIKEIFKLYQSGHGCTDIANTLNNKKWTHKYGKWTRQRVKYILSNAIYVGMITHNDQVFKGEHPPIIDEETFNRVSAIVSKEHNRHYVRRTFLSSKLICSKCGKMYCSSNTMSGGKRYVYYKHNDNQNFRADMLEKIIFDEMRKLTIEDVKSHRYDVPDTSKTLKKELEKIDKQRSRLLDLYSLGDFTTEEISAKIAPLNEQKLTLLNQISSTEQWQRPLEDMSKTIKSISDVLNSGDFNSIKMLVDELIDHIDVDGEDLTIYWNFN